MRFNASFHRRQSSRYVARLHVPSIIDRSTEYFNAAINEFQLFRRRQKETADYRTKSAVGD